MPAQDAVALINLFPATTECVLRSGYASHKTGLPGQVETLMVYSGGATTKMFGISGTAIYDVTAAGAVGAAVVSGLANARWQYCNVATAGGNFLYCANGTNTPYLYDGATWTSITGASTPAITGVTTTTLNSPIVHKNHVWFIGANTLKTWYLPVSSIGGAAAPIDMSSVAQLGGYIQAHCTWTIDAGTGVDDYYVAVTSNGEVIVYQGTDPTSITTWALKGVWRVGSPVGDRCMMKLGGDVLLICQDGVLPLSSALQSSRVNPRVALTDKIQWAVSNSVTYYGANFGWELFYFAGENQLWLNVPVGTGIQEQYAMNTISKNWCQYQGRAANTFEMMDDVPYFGGNGVVYKAWSTNTDNGAAITGTGLPAFSTYGHPGNLKRFTMTRPILRATGIPAVGGSMNIDFDVSPTNYTLSYGAAVTGVWDSTTWDGSVWSGMTVLQAWQGVSGVGYYAAPQIKITSLGIDVRWVSTDVVFEAGAIL